MRRVPAALLLTWCTSSARAQQGFDANGPDVPPLSDGPISLWSAEGMRRREVRFGALGEVGTGLLQQQTAEGARSLLPVAAGAHLSAAYAPTARVGLGVSVAVWPVARGGAGLGNLRFDVPISLVRSDELSVAIHPWGTLPSGRAVRGVSAPGPETGVVLAVGRANGLVQTHANLGAAVRRRVSFPDANNPVQQLGGPTVDFGAAIGMQPSRLRVDAEVRGAWAFLSGAELPEIPSANLFAEALLTGGGPLGNALRWRAGVGTGLTNGVGSPVARGFLGVSWSDRPKELLPLVHDDVPPEAVVDPVPVTERAPRTVPVRVQSETGAPLDADVVATSKDGVVVEAEEGALALLPGEWDVVATLEGRGTQARKVRVDEGRLPVVEFVLLEAVGNAALVHTVVDGQGNPVSGATVLIDGLPVGVTGSDGAVRIEGLAPGDHQLAIEHPRFTPNELSVRLADGPQAIDMRMARVPGTVTVRAVTGTGEPVEDAIVRFMGPRRLAPAPVEPDGQITQVLGPGTWNVLVSSSRFGFQEREISITETSFARTLVEVVLQPDEGGAAILNLRVVDPDGVPLNGVAVALDGQSFGDTSSGGTMRLEGLGEGVRELEVSSPEHAETEPVTVTLREGPQDHLVVLPWLPGTVRVRVRTPTGPLDDASVEFVGESSVPEVALGPVGEAVFQLEDGAWTALVVSPTAGFQERSFAVEGETGRRIDIHMVLSESEGGLANLNLEVFDPEGLPVHGAAVALDGVSLGSTVRGGLQVAELGTGRRSLDVSAPFFRAHTSSVQLMEGEQIEEVGLDWSAGAVRIEVTDGEGVPVKDAVVQLLGATSSAPVPVDADGNRLFELALGAWQALAISPTQGLAEASVLVTDEEGLVRVPIVLSPVAMGRADLVLRVVDTQGTPVSGASITMDGSRAGVTSVGGVLLSENWEVGNVAIEATATGYETAKAEFELTEGSQVRYLTLRAIPAQLTVEVADEAGNPVDAEVSLLGPNDWLPTSIGSDGSELFLVDPGRWTILASAAGKGTARGEIQLSPDSVGRLRLVLSKSQITVAGDQVVVGDVVLFDFGAASLRPEANTLLDEVANTLLANPQVRRVEVQGHSDAIGDLASNQALSQRRAASVLQALKARGVPMEVLIARGFGPQRPVADNDTEEGRAANRRVEFQIGQ